MTLSVFIDGSGHGTYGFVVKRDDDTIKEGSGEIDLLDKGEPTTNNVAEYAALVKALQWLKENQLHELEILVKSDSQLVVNQMGGYWHARSAPYIHMLLEAQALSKNFPSLKFVWIPRHMNKHADGLTRGRRASHDIVGGFSR